VNESPEDTLPPAAEPDDDRPVPANEAETAGNENFRAGFVAVVGRPNVGKSTLMNHFLGQKIAIISAKPQTTRRTQLGILTRPEAQIVFVDTPGMHEPRNPLGVYMVDVATRALNEADAVLFIVDVSVAPGPGDERLAELILLRPEPAPVVLAMNKADRLSPEYVIPHTEAYRGLVPAAEWLLVSATRGDNLDELLAALVRTLPLSPALYPEDEVTQTHVRDLAAEFIREAALNALEEEVPHGIAVEIDEFNERDANNTYIAATLYVERDSHKGIVIGKGGAMLKRIGSSARAEIERLLETKVYLDVHVKVRPEWRKRESDVRRMGYRPEK
jgi:GTP-binding protein Era